MEPNRYQPNRNDSPWNRSNRSNRNQNLKCGGAIPQDRLLLSTPKRLSPCKLSVFTQNSMAHRRKVGPCKSPCNWFSPMAHRDHRIKNIMILFCFGGQSQWHTALEVFNPWFCLALIKNIVLCPRSPWHKRFQTPYMTEIHHSFVITFLAPKQNGTPWFTIDEKCVV